MSLIIQLYQQFNQILMVNRILMERVSHPTMDFLILVFPRSRIRVRELKNG